MNKKEMLIEAISIIRHHANSDAESTSTNRGQEMTDDEAEDVAKGAECLFYAAEILETHLKKMKQRTRDDW